VFTDWSPYAPWLFVKETGELIVLPASTVLDARKPSSLPRSLLDMISEQCLRLVGFHHGKQLKASSRFMTHRASSHTLLTTSPSELTSNILSLIFNSLEPLNQLYYIYKLSLITLSKHLSSFHRIIGGRNTIFTMFLHGILAVFLMFNNGSIVAQPPPSTDPIVVAASGDVNIDQQTLQATATQIYALIGTIDAAVAAQRASDVFSPAQQLLLQARTVRSLVTNVGTDAKSASLQTDLQGVNIGNDVIM
jgi:hypothetical protein